LARYEVRHRVAQHTDTATTLLLLLLLLQSSWR